MIAAALSLNPFHYSGSRSRVFDPGKRMTRASSSISYVGRRDIPKRGADKSDQSAYNYVDVFPEFSQYKLPSRSPEDERYVLDDLCSHIRPRAPIACSYLERADEVLRDSTPKSLRPVWFLEGIPRIDDILNAIQMENRSRHPGYPGCLLGANKGVVIDRYLVDLVEAVYVRLIALKYVAPYCHTPEDFYHTFCSDLTSFSIKSEVVKCAKSGRGLCAVSIVTTVCEFLLYGHFDVAFKAARYENYSAIGIGFSKADSELLHSASPHPSMCSDVPTFDSTVDEFENVLNARAAMASQGASGRVVDVAVSLERAYAHKLFILSNGWVYAQNTPGYQCTGRRETSNFNTMTRARRSMAVDLVLLRMNYQFDPLTICAGDDCNETPNHMKEKVYHTLDFPLRDVEVTEDLTFCSHDWPVDSAPIGQRIHKSAFKLFLGLPLDYDRVLAFCREYHQHPDFQAYIKRIFAVRPEMKTILLEMFSQSYDAVEPDYACFTKKRTKVRTVAGLRAQPRRKLRGRGDYVEPTAEGFAVALGRIEDKLDKSRAPSIKNTATALGRTLGSLVPIPGASEFGATAGDWLAKYFGHGDYNIVTNSLIPGKVANMSGAPPEVVMSKDGKRGIRVVEREYICDILSGSLSGSATVFNNQSFVINPANPTTFPWLSTVAQGFEEYEVNGMIFEFRSTSSTYNGASQALGTVICATDYDGLDSAYSTKMQMENAAYANSAKASDGIHHGIECDRSEKPTKVLYTNAGSIPTNADARLFNVGNFQIATQGCSTANVNLGELWVAYDITFYKKDLFNGQLARGNLFFAAQLASTAAFAGSALFTGATAASSNTLAGTITGNTFYFPPNIQTGDYLVMLYAEGTAAVTAQATFLSTNCSLKTVTAGMPNNDMDGSYGSTLSKYMCVRVVTVTGQNASVSYATTGQLPTALTKSQFLITQVSNTW